MGVEAASEASIAAVRIIVLAVGRLRPPFADDVQHYQKLLAGHARVELIELRDEEHVARRVPDRAWVSLLDREGEEYDSIEFSRVLEERRQAGRDVCFVIGGPKGIDLEAVDHRLSLGRLTLPHQLARVVLLEQLYRGHKILAREPYHY
jgi:23S rRNA (pseudouridine1915-N3)-methyltransferase